MNTSTTKTKSISTNNIFFIIYFFTTFFGGKLFLEEYLFVEDLPIVYSMILGLTSALISGGLIYFLKQRKLSFKIIGGIILLGFIILLNILYT